MRKYCALKVIKPLQKTELNGLYGGFELDTKKKNSIESPFPIYCITHVKLRQFHEYNGKIQYSRDTHLGGG